MDLIVRLLGESASYAAAMKNATVDTNRFDQRLEELTRTMQRQQVASQLSTREAQVLAIADRGASVAAAEHALSVARELDSLDALAAAEQRVAKEKQQAAAVAARAAAEERADADRRFVMTQKAIDALQHERVAITQGTTAAKLYAIQQMDVSAQVKSTLSALTLRNEALAKSAAADRAAAAATRENEQWIAKTIQSHHLAARAYSESSINQKLHELATRGATDAQIDEVYAAIQVEQRNNQVTEALKRKQQAQQAATQATAAHTGGSKTNLFAIQALAFGLQDAAQVYGTTGLAGAISASANNLIFMTSLLNPHLAILTAVTVAVGQFAAVLGPAILGIENQKQATERLIHTQELQVAQQERTNQAIRDGNRALEEANSYQSAKSIVNNKESALRDLQEEQEQIQQVIIAQRQARDARQAIRDEEQRKLTLAGRAGTAVGLLGETVTQKEIEAFNQRIYDQQMKIFELSQKQVLVEKQLSEAKTKAATLDATERAAASRKEAADQVRQQNDDFVKSFKDRQEKADAERKKQMAARDSAKKAISGFSGRTRVEAQATKDDAKRQKLVNTLQARLQAIEQWKQAQLLTTQEVYQARVAAERAYWSQRRQLEQSIATRDAARTAADTTTKNQDRTRPETQTRAIDANSAEGYKAIFEATNGGENGTKALLVATEKNGKAIGQLVTLFEGYARNEGKKGVVRVK